MKVPKIHLITLFLVVTFLMACSASEVETTAENPQLEVPQLETNTDLAPTTTNTATSTPMPTKTLAPTKIPTLMPSETPTLAPTNTATPTVSLSMSSLDSYLADYCGPELIGWKNWNQDYGGDLKSATENGTMMDLICHLNEQYYFHVTGFNAGELIIPLGLQAMAPTGDLISLPVQTQGRADEEGNFVMALSFEDTGFSGDWEITFVGSENSAASTTLTYEPPVPKLSLYDQEVDEEGGITPWIWGSGWGPEQTLTMSAVSPYGELEPTVIGESEVYGVFGLFPLPPFPPDRLDGEYVITIRSRNKSASLAFICQNGGCELAPSPEEMADMMYSLGREAYKSGQYGQALAHYEEALSFNPNHMDALNMVAWVLAYHLDTDYEKAWEHALLAVEVLPDTHSHDTLALVYYKLEDFPNALFHYDISLFFDEESASSYRGRGDVYAAMGDVEAALADYEKFLTLDPESPERENIEAKIEALSGE